MFQKNIVLTLVKMIRKTLFRIIVIGAKIMTREERETGPALNIVNSWGHRA